MKKYLLLSMLSIIMFTANAQTKQEKAVQDAVESLRVAMVNADPVALERLVSDKLSYGHSSGQVDDSKEFVEKIITGQSDFLSIDLSEQTIAVSDETAIVRHVLKAETNDGGKPGTVHLRILLVWQKQGGQWKLLARQAVKMA
jgi:ketosteroid isomerase-like protein